MEIENGVFRKINRDFIFSQNRTALLHSNGLHCSHLEQFEGLHQTSHFILQGEDDGSATFLWSLFLRVLLDLSEG